MSFQLSAWDVLGKLLVIFAAVSGTTANAFSTDSKSDRSMTYTSPSPESKANSEFRKGIDATLKGKNEAAKSYFNAALALDASFAPALVGLADIAQKEGDRVQAEKHLRQAEAVAPNAAEVHIARGRFHLGGQDVDLAESSFKRARDLNPKSVTPLLELGDLYLRDTARRGDAVKSFAAAMELQPNNKYALYSFGVASSLIGRRDDAIKAFEKVAAMAPRDPEPLRAIGRLHLEAEALDKALQAFDLGLKRQPNFVPLMLDRGDALARKGKWSDAISQIGAAARLAPTSAEVQVKLGDAFQGAALWTEAQQAYEKAINIDGKNPLAYNNLAWMLVQRGDAPRLAVEAATKAVSLAPRSAPFLDTLGWAQRSAGDLPAAAESLQRATSIEPRTAEFQFHYGIILMELKRNGDARAALSQALSPHFPKADEARRLLRTLQAN